MHSSRVSWLSWSLGLCCVQVCAAQGLSRQEGRAGERLDPSTYGPAVVETRKQVEQRQAKLGPGSASLRGARNGAPGSWVIPSRRAHPRPHSGSHSVSNNWGDTRMGIGFGRLVDLEGAWFAGQGAQGAWTKGVRIVGFRAGEEVARSGWFEKIDRSPAWFSVDLKGVDRIEVHARAVHEGAGWYSLDDLTYRLPSADPASPGRRVVVDFDDLSYRRSLTGTGYAGLT